MANPDSTTEAVTSRDKLSPSSDASSIFVLLNAVWRWVLYYGNRWVVSAVALLIVGLALLGIGTIWPVEFVTLLTETQVIQTIFFTFLSGIILLVSIAVSVNSIVLSQEITALGNQEDEVDETFAFRDSVQEHTDTNVSPAKPAAFLQVIFDAVRINVEELLESVPNDNSSLHADTKKLRDDVIDQLQEVEYRLEHGEFGTSEVLFAGIKYNYSRQVYAIRRLRTEYEDELTDTQRESIDELLTVLKYFTIGREYFKTLYFKRELANLSRGLLVIAFPSIVFLSFSLLSLTAGLVPDFSILSIPSLIVFVVVTYVVGLAPYTVFSAYILRTATISVNTLAAGPFILNHDGDEDGLNAEIGEH